MSSTVETANEIRPFHVDIPEEDLGASAHSWSKLCPAVGGLAEPDDSGERIKGQFLGAMAVVLGGAPVVRLQSGGRVGTVGGLQWALRLCCLGVACRTAASS